MSNLSMTPDRVQGSAEKNYLANVYPAHSDGVTKMAPNLQQGRDMRKTQHFTKDPRIESRPVHLLAENHLLSYLYLYALKSVKNVHKK